jgi:hypothetical protein
VVLESTHLAVKKKKNLAVIVKEKIGRGQDPNNAFQGRPLRTSIPFTRHYLLKVLTCPTVSWPGNLPFSTWPLGDISDTNHKNGLLGKIKWTLFIRQYLKKKKGIALCSDSIQQVDSNQIPIISPSVRLSQGLLFMEEWNMSPLLIINHIITLHLIFFKCFINSSSKQI